MIVLSWNQRILISWQLSQLQTVAASINHLLISAPVDSDTSRNIQILTKLFTKKQNIDSFLSNSSLFESAREQQWGDLSTTRLRKDIAAVLTDHEFTQLLDNRSLFDLIDPKKLERALSEEPELKKLLSYDSKTRERSCTPVTGPTEAHVAKEARPAHGSQSYDRQLSAKLHVLYGVPVGVVHKNYEGSGPRYSLRHDTTEIHPYARSRVYDLRQHTDDGTFWGPFLDDGLQTVDWEKLEAIMIIINYNLKHSREVQSQHDGKVEVQKNPWVGAVPNSFISPAKSVPMEPALPLEAQDPYNITGTWTRIVCFLDYTALYDFNFGADQPEPGQPRKPIDTEEATRFITMKLQVTKIEAPGEDCGPQLPVVHFQGKSSSIRPSWDVNANSKIKGEQQSSLCLPRSLG